MGSQKYCPTHAVPKQFPFPNIRVDDRIPSNQTSNEGLSSRRAHKPPGFNLT